MLKSYKFFNGSKPDTYSCEFFFLLIIRETRGNPTRQLKNRMCKSHCMLKVASFSMEANQKLLFLQVLLPFNHQRESTKPHKAAKE